MRQMPPQPRFRFILFFLMCYFRLFRGGRNGGMGDVLRAMQIIGPGGKMIKQIIEDYELDALDVQDDGRVFISSFNSTSADR